MSREASTSITGEKTIWEAVQSARERGVAAVNTVGHSKKDGGCDCNKMGVYRYTSTHQESKSLPNIQSRRKWTVKLCARPRRRSTQIGLGKVGTCPVPEEQEVRKRNVPMSSTMDGTISSRDFFFVFPWIQFQDCIPKLSFPSSHEPI